MRHVRAILLAVVLSLLLPFATLALAKEPQIDMSRRLALSVDFQHFSDPVQGVAFDLYLVGTIDENAQVELVGDFESKYGVVTLADQGDWSVIARSMAEDLSAKGTMPVCTAVTGSDGRGTFEVPGGMTAGLYLMVGHDATIGKKTYYTYPFLFSMPMWDIETQDWTYTVCVYPKYGERIDGRPAPAPDTDTGERVTTPTSLRGLLAQTGDYLMSIWPHIVLGLSLIYMGLRLRKSNGE